MFLGYANLTGLLLLFLQNLEAIEKHFATARAPHLIEHLPDNGSCYTALETRQFAVALNLKPCFTPVKSPQSNGISEAFVKTLKRDYIKISNFPDSKSALRQINGWIKDYMKSIHIPRSIWTLQGCSEGQ